MMSITHRQAQRGQSMVEYLVVVSALLVAFLAAPNVIQELEQNMTARQQGYNYAMSLSQIPYPLKTATKIYTAEGMDSALIDKLTKPQKSIDEFNDLLDKNLNLPTPQVPDWRSVLKVF
ncbi:MAG: hypothetical protein P8Y64_12555 [Gammaproteobacteria bacterium]|jgi:hypothetical protein